MSLPCVMPDAKILGQENMVFGEPVLFDSFCFVQAQDTFRFGDFCHIHYYSSITGRAGFEMGDFCSLGPRVQVMTSSYLPGGIHNSTVPRELNNTDSAPVVMGSHSAFGSGCVVYPGVVLEEGVMFLPGSVVRPKLDGPFKAWTVYSNSRRVRDFTTEEITQYQENVQKAKESWKSGWRGSWWQYRVSPENR